MSKRRTRILPVSLGIIFVVAILLSVMGVSIVKHTFPQQNGEINLSELDDEVNVYRDEMGVPHIYASSLHDLFFAQGYIHAQDRFWQMDFWRHIGSGRLAEMFGEDQLETDIFLRTMGWGKIAEQEYLESSPDAAAILNAYADGVNAYLAEHSETAISLEYVILGLINPDYKPEPWTPVHTLTWAKAMAWDLRGNLDGEIERALLMKYFDHQQMLDLYPDYPLDHPVIVDTYSIEGETLLPGLDTVGSKLTVPAKTDNATFTYALQQASSNLAILNSVLGPSGTGIGSNSWVVSGKLTTTGKPILANDPHLGIQMPSIWYQIGLHCLPRGEECPFEVAGFSFAGVPGVIIGHNDRIAWAFTNNGPDVMDLYIEKVNPENPDQYEFNGEWFNFETRIETIQVGGGDPVNVTIRATRHGPVISDVYGLQDFNQQAGIELPDEFVVSLRWTALEPQHIFDAVWGFNRATNWEDFRYAARSFTVPAQNLLYADVDGNIAYQMPGLIPLRKNGDGTLPVPGWSGDYDWEGYIPFEQLPTLFNPDRGYIVTANNQAVPRDYPYLVTTDWDYGFRADRITKMIENAPEPIDIPAMQRMQYDTTNLNAETLVPILMSLPMEGRDEEVREFFMSNWDLHNDPASASALVFEKFWTNLLMETFNDELFPEGYFPSGGSRYYEVIRRLVALPQSEWWDDQTTMNVVETRDDIFLRAFAMTVQAGEEKHGYDLGKWPVWGDEHFATFRNQTLGKSGIGPIESIFNRGPYSTGGGESIVNATGWTVGNGFEVDWLPSMRMIVDLGELGNSVTVHTTGQSGHAYSPHYIDMAPLWASGKYYPMYWDIEKVIAASEFHLRMIP